MFFHLATHKNSVTYLT